MRNRKVAILDLGTNTFHILIARINGKSFHTLYREKIPVKIGDKGISDGKISKEAWSRAMDSLYYIRELIDRENIKDIYSIATSAIRNAKNGNSFLSDVKDRIGLHINTIDGDTEADYIYHGVKLGVNLGEKPALIMDIGGGSVEFIIGNNSEIFWKQSFEIGAQRLFDRYHIHDPLQERDISKLYKYLDIELKPLSVAIKELGPDTLVGSSGTFDTLSTIHFIRKKMNRMVGVSEKHIDIEAFHPIHDEIVSKNRTERLQIPGMVPMRADMIAVASCLVNYVIKKYSIKKLIASSFALKEGLLVKLLDSNKNYSYLPKP
ncbi:exopolyphosphatase [Bacteroidota bacterium]